MNVRSSKDERRIYGLSTAQIRRRYGGDTEEPGFTTNNITVSQLLFYEYTSRLTGGIIEHLI